MLGVTQPVKASLLIPSPGLCTTGLFLGYGKRRMGWAFQRAAGP